MLDGVLPFGMNLQHPLQDNAQNMKACGPSLHKITSPRPRKTAQQNAHPSQVLHPRFSVVEKLLITPSRYGDALLHGEIFIGSEYRLTWTRAVQD